MSGVDLAGDLRERQFNLQVGCLRVNFNLTFNADVSNIQTTALPNGKLRMRVQFIALTYNLDCLLQTAISKEMDGDVTPAELANLRKTGLPMTMQISIPAGPDFYVRIGI